MGQIASNLTHTEHDDRTFNLSLELKETNFQINSLKLLDSTAMSVET